MSRVLLPLCLGLSLLTSSTAAQRPLENRRPGPPLQLDLVARDRSGAPVTDLTKDDIELWIGGYRIPIENLAMRTDDTRVVTLLIDDITLTPVGLARAKEIARSFVARLAPGDQMAVLALSRNVTQSSADGAALTRRIDSIGPSAAVFARADDLSAHVLSTLASIARQVGETQARRRTVVAIGAGWLFDTPLPPPMGGRELRPEWTEAVRAMAGANVALYVIDPGGVGMAQVTGGGQGFARDTGGHAFINTNDFDGAVERIMRESVSYYSVEVLDPPVFRKAALRDLEVKVKRRGVDVAIRRYIPGTT